MAARDASRDIKQLRILSGTHAGASLDLSAGQHTLGDRHDCDISITDWRFDAITLRVDRDGTVLAQWGDAAPHALCFEDLAPVDFDGVVVCIGPCGEDWPERAQLLQRLQPIGRAIAPAEPPAAPARRIDRRIAWSGAAVVTALACAGWLATANPRPRDERVVTLRTAHAELQHALDAAAGGHLQVSESQGMLVVEGLVDDARQARAAALAMDAVPRRYEVARKVSVATDVAETIRSALGLPNAKIAYRGAGVFAVEVETGDADATQAAIARVAADLAPTVRRIDPLVAETAVPRPAMPAVLSTWVSGDGTTVMETRDGVKHLVPADLPAAVAPPVVRPVAFPAAFGDARASARAARAARSDARPQAVAVQGR